MVHVSCVWGEFSDNIQTSIEEDILKPPSKQLLQLSPTKYIALETDSHVEVSFQVHKRH